MVIASAERVSRHPSSPTLSPNVAPGIHRLTHAAANCYLVEAGSGLTIVDAGLPATWPFIKRAIRATGHTVDDVEGILLTHAHPDHLGFARRAQLEWGVPVYAHAFEAARAAQVRSSREDRPSLRSTIRHPKAIGTLLTLARAGALRVDPITELESCEHGDELRLPGAPVVVFTPGHTAGHCSFLVRDAAAILTGDALVTLDPMTGATGPQVVLAAPTVDADAARRSLATLAEACAELDAAVVLPGHGPAWRDGVARAVELARAGIPQTSTLDDPLP